MINLNNKKIIHFDNFTRTAAEAAEQLKCQVSQIAKTIVFRTANLVPIIVIASGSNRINERKISLLVGGEISKPDADFVKRCTGFTIGGIPPYGHLTKIRTIIDKDLANYDVIWASAGMNNAVFETNYKELMVEADAEAADIK